MGLSHHIYRSCDLIIAKHYGLNMHASWLNTCNALLEKIYHDGGHCASTTHDDHKSNMMRWHWIINESQHTRSISICSSYLRPLKCGLKNQYIAFCCVTISTQTIDHQTCPDHRSRSFWFCWKWRISRTNKIISF